MKPGPLRLGGWRRQRARFKTLDVLSAHRQRRIADVQCRIVRSPRIWIEEDAPGFTHRDETTPRLASPESAITTFVSLLSLMSVESTALRTLCRGSLARWGSRRPKRRWAELRNPRTALFRSGPLRNYPYLVVQNLEKTAFNCERAPFRTPEPELPLP